MEGLECKQGVGRGWQRSLYVGRRNPSCPDDVMEMACRARFAPSDEIPAGRRIVQRDAPNSQGKMDKVTPTSISLTHWCCRR